MFTKEQNKIFLKLIKVTMKRSPESSEGEWYVSFKELLKSSTSDINLPPNLTNKSLRINFDSLVRNERNRILSRVTWEEVYNTMLDEFLNNKKKHFSTDRLRSFYRRFNLDYDNVDVRKKHTLTIKKIRIYLREELKYRSGYVIAGPILKTYLIENPHEHHFFNPGTDVTKSKLDGWLLINSATGRDWIQKYFENELEKYEKIAEAFEDFKNSYKVVKKQNEDDPLIKIEKNRKTYLVVSSFMKTLKSQVTKYDSIFESLKTTLELNDFRLVKKDLGPVLYSVSRDKTISITSSKNLTPPEVSFILLYQFLESVHEETSLFPSQFEPTPKISIKFASSLVKQLFGSSCRFSLPGYPVEKN